MRAIQFNNQMVRLDSDFYHAIGKLGLESLQF
jgi:hypothetical protein